MDALVDLEIFFLFNINQIIDMKRKRNGAEIKSVRPQDVLFPLFPHAKLYSQINYSEVDGEVLEKWRRKGAHMASVLTII